MSFRVNSNTHLTFIYYNIGKTIIIGKMLKNLQHFDVTIELSPKLFDYNHSL